jgi:hypothetical protein
MHHYKSSKTIMPLVILLAGAVLVAVPLMPSPGEALNIFEDINSGLLSIGGRATYYDPNDADGAWYGGAQVRLYLFEFLAFEGSVDYRQNDFDSTRVRSYPVQVSALLYPFGRPAILDHQSFAGGGRPFAR